MSFYENYVTLCNKRYKSPSSIAAEIGVERSSVSRWARGSVPRYATLVKLADYFQISVGELVGATNDNVHDLARQYGISAELLLDQKDKPVDFEGDSIAEWLDELRTRPETRTLLAATRGMSKEQVEMMANFAKTIRNGGD